MCKKMSRAKRQLDQLEEVGRRLKAARESLGLRTIDLCAEINVQPNTYSQWENGARLLDVFAATRMAERFGVTLDWFYRGDASGLPHGLAMKVLTAAASFAMEPAAKAAYGKPGVRTGIRGGSGTNDLRQPSSTAHMLMDHPQKPLDPPGYKRRPPR